MPPSYTPLTGGIPGVPASLFNVQDPSKDWTDDEKAQALLLAQSIANQTNSLKLDDATQTKQRQDALRAAIANSFQQDATSAQTNHDQAAMTQAAMEASPGNDFGALVNVPDATPKYDASKAFATAEQLAMQGGDLGDALDIQKVLKPNGRTASDRILTDDEIDQLNAANPSLKLNYGATAGDVNLQMTSLRYGAGIDKESRIGNEFDRSQGFKEDQAKGKESAPGIWANNINPDGTEAFVNPKQQDNLGKLVPAVDAILRNGTDLIDRLQDDKISIGDKMQAQKQDIAAMFPYIRALDNQGVRMNEFIKGLDVSQIGDSGDFADRVIGSFTGQDPAVAVQRFLTEITKQVAAAGTGNNSHISPEAVQRLMPNSYDLFSQYGLIPASDSGDSGDNSDQSQFQDSGQDSSSGQSSGQSSSIMIPKTAPAAPQRPGLSFSGNYGQGGLPIYMKK